jgi:preprotein translocase subunit SecG
VLLQHGKGADVGAAFGSGSSGSIFGATGSANFLSRATAVLAVVFFATSMSLTWFSSKRTGDRGVMVSPSGPSKPIPADVPVPSAPAGPAAPADDGSKAGSVPK